MIFTVISLVTSVFMLVCLLQSLYQINRETKTKGFIIIYSLIGTILFVGQCNIILNLFIELFKQA